MKPAAGWPFSLSVGDWSSQQAGAAPVRLAVFVEEQGVPLALEWDEEDATSLHVVARTAAGVAIGTGRLLPDGHIGRLAVCRAHRGKGVGSALLQTLMQQARHQGMPAVLLHAQIQAAAFYAAHGFVPEGEEFLEAGIRHILMRHHFASTPALD